MCLAEGLTEDGHLYTIEANTELEYYIIRKYIQKAGWEDRITLHIGQAEDIVPQMSEYFDLVFIDAGKNDYAMHYDLVIDKVRPGGFILADNVLWDGKVPAEKKDRDTEVMHAFNVKIQHDTRVENVLLPIRDGISIIRKVE